MPTPFSLNSIKGRVAETIIQELFLAHDYNVFHYGMEPDCRQAGAAYPASRS